jgi:trimethylamine--corrinoid protein Co-methyltransferase
LDVIHKVGIGRDYLGQRHTMEHFRQEHFMPIISDRSSFDTWMSKGAKDLLTRAADEVRRIFKEHQVEPLRPEVAEIAKELVKKRANLATP